MFDGSVFNYRAGRQRAPGHLWNQHRPTRLGNIILIFENDRKIMFFLNHKSFIIEHIFCFVVPLN